MIRVVSIEPSCSMDPNDPIPLGVVSLGLVSSIVMYLSPIPVMRTIVGAKDVGVYRPDSFIIGIIYSISKLPYPVVNYQIGPLISSGVSFVLYTVYYSIYTAFTPRNKQKAMHSTLAAAVAVTVIIEALGPLIFFHVDPAWAADRGGPLRLVEIWFGVCSTIAVVLLMSSQLTSIRQVIRSRDSVGISGWMLAGHVFCATCWSVYSLLIMDPFFIAANAIGDTACAVQIAVKLRYRKPGKSGDDELVKDGSTVVNHV